MRIVVGCDLAAYDFKIRLVDSLRKEGYDITDIGCESSQSGDYPVYGRLVGEKVASGEFDRGIVICGTGNGITIAANKVDGIRAALCYNVFTALMSREHNDANVLGLGAWILSDEEALKIVKTWLFGKFSGGRHVQRIEMLHQIEQAQRA